MTHRAVRRPSATPFGVPQSKDVFEGAPGRPAHGHKLPLQTRSPPDARIASARAIGQAAEAAHLVHQHYALSSKRPGPSDGFGALGFASSFEPLAAVAHSSVLRLPASATGAAARNHAALPLERQKNLLNSRSTKTDRRLCAFDFHPRGKLSQKRKSHTLFTFWSLNPVI